MAKEGPSEDSPTQGASLHWQFVAFFFFIVLLTVVYGAYRRRRRRQCEKKRPYRVVKRPQNVGEGKPNKRVVAVLGGTGFVGSHIVDRLLETGDYSVYVLGRTFRDDRVNPQADALIQVDMTDLEGLCSAFQGVDTVVHSAIAVPTVYTSVEEVVKVNEMGAALVLSAAQKCGVENLVLVSGLQFKPPVKDHFTTVMFNCFKVIERKVLEAGINGSLRTCAVRFGQLYGVRSPIFGMILTGEIPRSPLLDLPGSFTPVEFAADVIIQAEKRLAEKDTKVVGKLFKVTGYSSTLKEFLTIPEWELEIKHMPILVLKVLANVNFYIAKVTGWAPMGPEFVPSITAFFGLTEEDVDNSTAEEILGIGKVPNIKEGVKAMVEKYKRKKELKKKK